MKFIFNAYDDMFSKLMYRIELQMFFSTSCRVVSLHYFSAITVWIGKAFVLFLRSVYGIFVVSTKPHMSNVKKNPCFWIDKLIFVMLLHYISVRSNYKMFLSWHLLATVVFKFEKYIIYYILIKLLNMNSLYDLTITNYDKCFIRYKKSFDCKFLALKIPEHEFLNVTT